MGGRGMNASGRTFEETYRTVGHIGGIPVLQPLPPLHGRLPEESHTSNAYILLHPDGTFRMLRWYDKQHRLRMEIAYHREPSLDPSGAILHLHSYHPGDFSKRKTRLLTERDYRRFRRFFGKELKWTTKK